MKRATTKRTRLALTLTAGQLDDLMACVDFALRQGAAYGHLTAREQALAEANRKRLARKLAERRAQFEAENITPEQLAEYAASLRERGMIP